LELRRALALPEPRAWCELVRDVAALANSGGGVIVIGVDRQGRPTGEPLLPGRADVADLVERLAVHTGERFDDIVPVDASKDGQRLVAIVVGERTGSPLLFERAGSYEDGDGVHEVFGQGTTYFRHGPRSAPANARDVARFAKKQERRVRREIDRNLRRVSAAPPGSHVLVVPPSTAPVASVERVRLVDDPDAPAVALADFDVTHPYRQKEVIAAVNARLGAELVNAHTILCVRRVHDTDAREELFHKPRFGSPQYSDAFIDWVVASYRGDPAFFEAAKAEYRRRQLERRAR
jgi:hypothetical protein